MLTTSEIGADANATGADNATFKITNAKLFVLAATLSTEDNAKLTKQWSEAFKRSVYWNKHKIIPNKTYNETGYRRELFDTSYQGATRLFVLAYDNATGNNQVSVDSFKKYFLPRVKIEN